MERTIELTEVFQVADGVYQIATETTRTETSCSIYFVVDQKTALIETGPASAIPAILRGVCELGYRPNDISYVIATHIHVDHGGGLGCLAQQLPGTKIVVHKKGIRHVIDPARLIESTRQVFGDGFEQELGPILPVPEGQILPVEGGEALSLGQRELRIIYTPGHSPHHVCMYDTLTKGLFCGEALGLRYEGRPIVLPSASPPSYDLELAQATIERLKEFNPEILFYSHYGVTREVNKSIKSVEETTRDCGDVVLAAMKSGQDIEQIIKRLEDYMSDKGYKVAEGSSWKGNIAWLLANGYYTYFKKRGVD